MFSDSTEHWNKIPPLTPRVIKLYLSLIYKPFLMLPHLQILDTSLYKIQIFSTWLILRSTEVDLHI